MKFFVAFLFFLCISSHDVNANAFSEVFGSEGASGINNSKIRSLSYTFQYFTVVGSIGYVAKQLFDSGYLELHWTRSRVDFKFVFTCLYPWVFH